MKKLLVDCERCVGCELCSMRCSLEKTGLVNPAFARIHIIKREADGVMIPAVCHHCADSKCIPACPVNCISKDLTTGRVSIDMSLCTGCKLCTRACPFAGPVRLPLETAKTKNVKALCDLCDGNPKCVTVCPTGALRYVEVDAERFAEIETCETRIASLLQELNPPPTKRGYQNG